MAFAYHGSAHEVEALKRRCSRLENKVVYLMFKIDRLETALVASRRDRPPSPPPSYEQAVSTLYRQTF